MRYVLLDLGHGETGEVGLEGLVILILAIRILHEIINSLCLSPSILACSSDCASPDFLRVY